MFIRSCSIPICRVESFFLLFGWVLLLRVWLFLLDGADWVELLE